MKFGPRLTLVHDSNLARSSAAVATVRGLERSDSIFSPGVDFLAELPVSRQVIFLDADLGYDFHRRNKRLNRHRILIDGGARLRFSRCSGELGVGYSVKQSDISDLLDLAPVRNAERTKRIGLDARCGGPVGLIPNVQIERGLSDNSSDIRRRSDNRSTSLSLGLTYARPSFGELGLVSNLTRVRYPLRDSLLDDALTDNGYRVVSIGGHFERNLGARISGSARINFTKVKPFGPTKDFSGITALGNLNFVVSPSLKARFNAARDVEPANDLAGSFSVIRTLAIQVEYALGTRISLIVGASQDDRSVRGGLEFPSARIDNERRRILFGRVGYRQGERALIDFELKREARTADPSIFDYESMRATANLKIFI